MNPKILIPVAITILLGGIAVASTGSPEYIEMTKPTAYAIEAQPEIIQEPIPELIPEPIEIIAEYVEEPQTEPTDDRTSTWTDEELLMLAKMTMAEAEGECLEGKCLVARVILNRVESEIFPDSIEAVISQKMQFSSWTNGRYTNAEPSDEVWQAVEMVCFDDWDESEGALYFEATYCQDTWQSKNRPYLFTLGGHKFYQ